MKPKKLETAIRGGDLDKVRELITAGTDVSSPFADGTKPIQLAARERQTTILRALAAAGADLADLEVLDFQERLTLFVDSSLEEEPDDDLLSPSELSEWAMRAAGEQMDPKLAAEIAEMEGALFRAVRIGDLELLKELIAGGEDVNQVRDITRDTPLTLAVQKGDEEMVRELLGAGANIDHTGFSTPLSFALPDLRLAKLLLDAGADVRVRGLDQRTPLERAVHRVLNPGSSDDSILLVRFFLEAGVHPPSAESFEGTLLTEAEFDEAWELYQELLPHYSEKLAGESFEELLSKQRMQEADDGFMNWTFDLRYAVRQGDLEELSKLLAARRKEPDGGEGRRDFGTEVGMAVWEALAHLEGAPQLEAARLLIDAGADLDAVKGYEKRRGSSPLACAAESWHRLSKEAMRLLLDSGAAVDQRGHHRRTPLMYAVLVAYRHGLVLEKAVPLLLGAGADPDLQDEFGFTAWTLARAPLIEAEERTRLGVADLPEEVFFDGPDLSDLFSASANKADRRRDRLERCREALELLAEAGAKPHGEAELRLMMAAAAGDATRLDELLAAGASADARGTDGNSAIAVAAEQGHGDVVTRLIAAGCDVDAGAVGEPSALAAAAGRADVTMTRQLIDAGANVAMMAMGSLRTLAAAAKESGSPQAAEAVELIRGAMPPQLANIDRDVDAEIAADDLYYDSKDELPKQAAFGDLEKVRELLAVEGIEIDGYDPLRRTALSAAAEAGRADMVRELIASGAEVDKCNGVVGSPRSTPLACAAISSSPERDVILRLLLEAGADRDRLGADGRTALMHAVERDVGFFGRVGEFALSTRTLIAAGADLEIRDPYGLTAWMRAENLASTIVIDEVAEQYEKIAALLEEAGASTAGLPDIELLWAVVAGENDRVSELLAAGADTDARGHDGATALMLAVRDRNREIAQLLIAAGCDVDAKQWVDRGPTAMEAADSAGGQALIRTLSEAGASPVVDKLRRPRTAKPIHEG